MTEGRLAQRKGVVVIEPEPRYRPEDHETYWEAVRQTERWQRWYWREPVPEHPAAS